MTTNTDNELTTGAAFAAMEAGETIEDVESGTQYRLEGDVLRSKVVRAVVWLVDTSNIDWLLKRKWRRVPAPKTPRVHELAGKWRSGSDGLHTTSYDCADELEAALKADELVSLKDVTAKTLVTAYLSGVESGTVVVHDGITAIIDYLRNRKVSP